jgi:glycosyltransferase involved in cell wall biosynthesis
LIECFSRLAQQSAAARLLIVGDGPGREHLEREFGARNLLPRIHFTGSVSPEAVPGYLASMDVAVAPYAPQANFYSSPLKIYEYMAAGLPIIASRIGQIEEVIQHEVTGLLVPPGDFAAFARALTDLQLNPEMRQSLGAAARAAVQEHTWDHILDHVLSLVGIEAAAEAAL